MPALAFLTWRMSIENICNIEGLRAPKATQMPLQLIGPRWIDIEFENDDLLRWTYAAFFGLVADLENFHLLSRRMIIRLSEKVAYYGFL